MLLHGMAVKNCPVVGTAIGTDGVIATPLAAEKAAGNPGKDAVEL
jgi:hypothetical protein